MCIFTNGYAKKKNIYMCYEKLFLLSTITITETITITIT